MCKLWHDISQRIFDREIHLTVSPRLERPNSKLFRRLQADELFQTRVQRICVEDWFCSGELPLQAVFEDSALPEWLSIDGPGFLEPRDESTWRQIEQLSRIIPLLRLNEFA